MTKPFREFWFGWGYVESMCYAQLPMRHTTGFDTFREAIEDLKLTTLKAYNIVYELTDWQGNPTEKALSYCCVESSKKIGDRLNFCFVCGTNIRNKENEHANPTDENIVEFFRRNIFFSNNDSSPSEIWEVFENNGWSFTEGVTNDAIFVEYLDRWLNADEYGHHLNWDRYNSEVVGQHDNDQRGEDN